MSERPLPNQPVNRESWWTRHPRPVKTCERATVGYSAWSSMQLRTCSILLFVLLFVISTNRCAIAAAFPNEVEECCENERGSTIPSPASPCGANGCAPCTTLDSGVNLAALAPLSAAAPVWTEDQEFAELVRRLALAARWSPPVVHQDVGAIPSPPWSDVLKKALPVRAPSTLA